MVKYDVMRDGEEIAQCHTIDIDELLLGEVQLDSSVILSLQIQPYETLRLLNMIKIIEYKIIFLKMRFKNFKYAFISSREHVWIIGR